MMIEDGGKKTTPEVLKILTGKYTRSTSRKFM